MDSHLYNNWYVLFVATGKEKSVQQAINKISPITLHMKIFERELIHITKGKAVKVLNTVFPGYIFVHEKIHEALKAAQNILTTEYVRCINIDGRPCRVNGSEMRLLLTISDYTGIFRLSYGFKKGDEIVITRGPLKNVTGRIEWIEQKKKKAKVHINLFNRKIYITLGIDFFEHKTYKRCA